MTIKNKAYIVGAYEHPLRKAPDKSVAQLHAEVAKGAIEDAGLTKDDIDGYFCAGDAPGANVWSMANYMNLKLRHVDSTDMGGCSYLVHVAHAAEAIAAGKCNVALITLAGRPNSEGSSGTQVRERGVEPARRAVSRCRTARSRSISTRWCAMRHMHEYGTTSEQLAWVKVAASHHAQHNPNAMLKNVVTVEEVVEFADDLRSAAPSGLLRGERRRRCLDRGAPGDREAAQAAEGEDHRRQAKRPSTRWAARSI